MLRLCFGSLLVLSISALSETFPQRIVDSIDPVILSSEGLSADDTSKIRVLINGLANDDPGRRETSEYRLIAWARKDPRVLLFLQTVRSNSLDHRFRMERAILSAALDVTWEQARYQLFRAVKRSGETATLRRALMETMALLTEDQKRTLSDSAQSRSRLTRERANAQSSPFEVEKTADEFEAELFEKLDAEVAIFAEALEKIGYRPDPSHLQPITKTLYKLDFYSELGVIRCFFHTDEDFRYMTLPKSLFQATEKNVFGLRVRFPNGKGFRNMSSIQLSSQIAFSWKGEHEFYTQPSDSRLVRSEDPLVPLNGLFEGPFPESVRAIRAVGLSAAGAAKLRSFGNE